MTPKHEILNKFGTCVVCRAQSQGLAVGEPGRLGWYCEECGPERAERIVKMKEGALNKLEQDAVMRLLEDLPETITVPAGERVLFIEWIIAEFGKNVRRELDANTPPF